jgi:hypothetical protein
MPPLLLEPPLLVLLPPGVPPVPDGLPLLLVVSPLPLLPKEPLPPELLPLLRPPPDDPPGFVGVEVLLPQAANTAATPRHARLGMHVDRKSPYAPMTKASHMEGDLVHSVWLNVCSSAGPPSESGRLG